MTDGKIALGKVFDKFLTNVNNQKNAIEQFSNLNPSLYYSKNKDINWDDISDAIGSTDSRLIGYLKTLQQTDGTINTASASTQGFSEYLRKTGQAYDFAALKATLLNTALNAGITLAVVAAVKLLSNAWDYFNVTVAESQEKIDATTSRLNELNAEYEALSSRNPDSLSPTEKERLDYLNERIDKEKELLQLQQANAAEEEIGGKFTDLFDKDSFSQKMLFEKFGNISLLDFSTGNASENLGMLMADTQASVTDHQYLIDNIAQQKQEKASSPKGSAEYQAASEQLKQFQSQLDDYDYSPMQDQLTIWKEKKLQYEEAIAQLEEHISNPYISSKSRNEAIDKKAEYESWLEHAEISIDTLSNILHEPQLLIDSLDERLSNLSASDLKGRFSETELTTLANMSFDTDATIEELEDLLNTAQEKADDTPIEPRVKTSSDLVTVLSDMGSYFDKINAAYQEFTAYGKDGISTESLSGIVDTFSDMEGVDVDGFIDTIYSSTSTAEDVEAAFASLASQYIYSSGCLDNLTDATAQQVIQELKLHGVANAESIVMNQLAAQKELAALKSFDLASATSQDILQLISEGQVSAQTADHLAAYALRKQLANGTTLTTSGDIANIISLVRALGGATTALTAFQKAKGGRGGIELANPKGKGKSTGNNKTYLEGQYDPVGYTKKEAQKEIDAVLSQDYNGGNTNTPSSPGTPSTGGGNGSSSSPEPEPTIETFNFIETVLERISSKIDALKTKAEETFQSFQSRGKAYADSMNKVTEEISLQNQAYGSYMARANSVGLDEYWAQQVRDGSINIADISDDTLKEQIHSYQEWYEKARQCKEEIQDLEKTQKELAQAKIELLITKYGKLLSRTESANSRIEQNIDIKDSRGGAATTKDYGNINKNNVKMIRYYAKQNAELKNLQKTVAKGSEAWYEYQEQIDSNNASIRDLKLNMAETAKAAAALAGETAEIKIGKYDSKNELLDAKIDNTVSVKKQNSLIDSKIGNIGSQQKAYEDAVATDKKNISKAKRSLNHFKTTKENKKLLSEIKKYTKAGKKIPQKLLKLANGLKDNGNLYKACIQYNAYIDAYNTDKEAAELFKQTSKQDIAGLELEKFNNIQDSHEREQNQLSQKADKVSSAMDLSEAKGRLADQSYYRQLIIYEKANKKKLETERKKLKESLDSSLASGKIEKYSDEWWEMTDAIHAVDEALAQSDLSLQEFSNQLQQVGFDNFNYLQEQISRLTQEADFYIDLMSGKPLTDDQGLTEYGTAAMGLHYQNYNTYTNQAKQYAEEIKRINAMLAKDSANTTLLAQLQEYQDMQQECILNAEDEKKAVTDLVKEGYEALIDALGNSIHKYKELLQNVKDAHDYQKNISQQSETISTLKKQISAYSSMSGSEETAAKLQRLKDELEDAQSSLQETMYDKYISDTQDAMDDMLNGLEDFLNDLSQDMDKLFHDGIDQVTNSTDNIQTTLTSLSKDYNTTLSNAMATTWGHYKNAEGGVDTIIAAFNNMMEANDREHDTQAYTTASKSYQDYTSYEVSLEENNQKVKEAKAQRKDAKKKVDDVKKELDKAEKKYGKKSPEYESLYKIWKEAKEAYKEADKVYKDTKQKSSDLETQIENAKEEDKTVVQDFLYSIVGATPTKSTDQMDTLDLAVKDITGGYLSDYNRQQILNLLHAGTEQDAVTILEDLGLLKLTPAVKHAKDNSEENSMRPTRFNPDDFVLITDIKASGATVGDSAAAGTFLAGTSGITDAYIQTTQPVYSSFAADKTTSAENVSVTVGDIYLPDVTDPRKFATELVNVLKNDITVQKTFGTFVNASLTGGNSLSTRKY